MCIRDRFRSTKEELGNKIEKTKEELSGMNKNMEDLKEDNQSLSKKIDETNKKMEEEMGKKLEDLKEDNQSFKEEFKATCLLYTSRCV